MTKNKYTDCYTIGKKVNAVTTSQKREAQYDSSFPSLPTRLADGLGTRRFPPSGHKAPRLVHPKNWVSRYL